jgi:prefoldin subunit 5
MDEPNLKETAERLASAADALERAIAGITEHYGTLSTKIERIVAAVEESEAESREQLQRRVADLERANTDLKAEAARLAASRKTLPPLVTALLSKSGLETNDKIELATLDQALATLPVDQRIAVKAQMARAGLIE